jgi:hypothetical protein
MKFVFPWEIPEVLEDNFSGPYLFLALYRLYRNAYIGKCFQLTGNTNIHWELKERIEQLPIDIKRIVLSKIWEEGQNYKAFVAKGEDLLLELPLLYLLSQYGKLKTEIDQSIPIYYGSWHGTRISRKLYIFTYGLINPRLTPLIPDFECRDKKHPMCISFGLVCP